MKRWLKQASLGLLLSAASSAAPVWADAAAPRPRPNVIVILADDLGYADVGAQGLSADVRTPNIDSIAASGARFTQGYVSCPVCSPSRAGFLTGRYQERFGHDYNPGPDAPNNFGLPLDQVTIADRMKAAGYATGLVGKWHEGSTPDRTPTKRGFDETYGFLGGSHQYLGNNRLGANRENAIRRNNVPVPEPEYLTNAISREAVAFIDRHKGEPFFLYVPYNAVHQPQEAPQKYQDRFADVKDKKRKLMLAMLSAEDDGVGEILGKLKKENIEDNTLVFFFSDNGGPTSKNGSRNTPLAGFKGQVWEGGIRIPFMAKWPGHIKPGQVLDQPVISLDILPTALAVVGDSSPSKVPLDGVNLLPLLEGKTVDRPHDVLHWEFAPQWAVRAGDLKLVGFANDPPKLFDLKADVSEHHDLASARPADTKRLLALHEQFSATLPPPLWAPDKKFRRPRDEAMQRPTTQEADDTPEP